MAVDERGAWTERGETERPTGIPVATTNHWSAGYRDGRRSGSCRLNKIRMRGNERRKIVKTFLQYLRTSVNSSKFSSSAAVIKQTDVAERGFTDDKSGAERPLITSSRGGSRTHGRPRRAPSFARTAAADALTSRAAAAAAAATHKIHKNGFHHLWRDRVGDRITE